MKSSGSVPLIGGETTRCETTRVNYIYGRETSEYPISVCKTNIFVFIANVAMKLSTFHSQRQFFIANFFPLILSWKDVKSLYTCIAIKGLSCKQISSVKTFIPFLMCGLFTRVLRILHRIMLFFIVFKVFIWVSIIIVSIMIHGHIHCHINCLFKYLDYRDLCINDINCQSY